MARRGRRVRDHCLSSTHPPAPTTGGRTHGRPEVTGERLRLMAVHAHPDDESSKGAATTAKYAAEGVDVLVVSCTGGERGDVLNPRLRRGPGRDRGHAGAASRRDGRRRRRARRAAPLARLRRLGSARGRPAAAAAGGLLRARPAGGGGGAAGRAGPQLQAARDHHVRRERRLSAPGPHHVPQGVGGGVRGGGRPGALRRPRRAVDAVEALLQRRLLAGAHARDPRGAAGGGPRVAVRRVDRVPRGPGDARARGHHPDRRQRLLRAAGRGVARARHPDRPGRVLLRDAARDRAGQWPTEEYELAQSRVPTNLPEADLFAGLRGDAS